MPSGWDRRPASAWDSPIVKCTLCKTPGCRYRTVADSEYCCQACSGEIVTPGGCVPTAKGVIPDQDKFHAKRGPANDATSGRESESGKARKHDAACSMLDEDVLRSSWWEEFRIDDMAVENAACLVVPPVDAAASGPAPVVLFLGGDGHVDDKQDALWGGVDLLIRNPQLRQRCFLLSPRPRTACGLLRYNDKWMWTWSEDAVWSLFTEVLRRLGPGRVDPARIFVTGLSLGATGTWNLAIRYGHHLAAIAPVSGAGEWPDASWPRSSGSDESVRPRPDETVLARLKELPIRAYAIDVDVHAGNQKHDMDQLCCDLAQTERDLVLPGMEEGKSCNVHVHEWSRTCGGATWALWSAAGPLNDWSAWDDWGGDKHFLWQRVYPLPAWGLADFLRQHSVPEGRQWRFDSPPTVVDIRSKIMACLSKAGKACEGGARKTWQEQVQEFVRNFFDALWSACGDRPCFDKVDFTSDVSSGMSIFGSAQLLTCMDSAEFTSVLSKAVHICRDKVRYQQRSFLILRRAIRGKDLQRVVGDAVNGAREEIASEMFTITADEFISTWIRKTKANLQESGMLDRISASSALTLFRDLVSTGGGMPVPLMKSLEGVTVADWKPLSRTVNMLFDDDPEPVVEKSKWDGWSKDPKPPVEKSKWDSWSKRSEPPVEKTKWDGWSRDRNKDASFGAWGNGSAWANPTTPSEKGMPGGGSYGQAQLGSGSKGGNGSWMGSAAPPAWGKATAGKGWGKWGHEPY